MATRISLAFYGARLIPTQAASVSIKQILSSHRINDFLLRYNSYGDFVFLIVLKKAYADPRQTDF